MKKIIVYTIAFIMFTAASFSSIGSINVSAEEPKNIDSYEITMKQDILCLMMGYPGYITKVERGSDGRVYLIMKSGRKILYDDKKDKSQEAKIDFPDLEDMLKPVYPLSPITNVMEKAFDPGRARVYELLSEVYGGSRQAVQANLVNVNVGGKNYQFNKSNNAALSLRNVMNELKVVGSQNGGIWGFITPASGTFNYRVISGSGRLSPHAFAIAIDLNRDSRDYWKWATPEQATKRIQSYSKELVEVFEKHNFVWGGKWGHFDILHFEYRPEIILKAKYFSSPTNNSEEWYNGVPTEDAAVKSYIDIIDDALKS